MPAVTATPASLSEVQEETRCWLEVSFLDFNDRTEVWCPAWEGAGASPSAPSPSLPDSMAPTPLFLPPALEVGAKA